MLVSYICNGYTCRINVFASDIHAASTIRLVRIIHRVNMPLNLLAHATWHHDNAESDMPHLALDSNAALFHCCDTRGNKQVGLDRSFD
jgi:hypothetical protein